MSRSVRLTSVLLAVCLAWGCASGSSTPVPSGSPEPTFTATPTTDPTVTAEPSVTPTSKPTAAPTPAATATRTPAPTALKSVFVATGSMTTGRWFETATKLKDGRVLIVGGMATAFNDSVLGSAELYNPATGSTTLVGSLHTPRFGHVAALLNDGRVLIAGGEDANGAPVRPAEFFNPSTKIFTPAGNTPFTDFEPCNATTLKDGRVLFAGGWSIGSHPVNVAVIYSPGTAFWWNLPPQEPMVYEQCTAAAALMPNGKVLIVGGTETTFTGTGPTRAAQFFDPSVNTFSSTGSMAAARIQLRATVLSPTKVLITGGRTTLSFPPLATTEIYNGATGTFGPGPAMAARRARHTATTLPNGKILIVGGAVDIPVNPCPADPPAELFDPVTGWITNTARTVLCRTSQLAVLLDNGRVLLIGGGPTVGLDQDRTMELYVP